MLVLSSAYGLPKIVHRRLSNMTSFTSHSNMCHATWSVHFSLTHIRVDDQHSTFIPLSLFSLCAQTAVRSPIPMPEHIPIDEISTTRNIGSFTPLRHYQTNHGRFVIPLQDTLPAPAKDVGWEFPVNRLFPVPNVISQESAHQGSDARQCCVPSDDGDQVSMSNIRTLEARDIGSGRIFITSRSPQVTVFPYKPATRRRLYLASRQSPAADATNSIRFLKSSGIRELLSSARPSSKPVEHDIRTNLLDACAQQAGAHGIESKAFYKRSRQIEGHAEAHWPASLPSLGSTKPSRSEDQNCQRLTHLTSTGDAHMVDIGHKMPTRRSAAATAFVLFSNIKPYVALTDSTLPKGDAVAVARIAGIQAAKKTADLIPLAHPGLGITGVKVAIELLPPSATKEDRDIRSPMAKEAGFAFGGVKIIAHVSCEGKTGVEMEALTAANVAALTIYDMCKAVDMHMLISGVRVIMKNGGKSGSWKLETDVPDPGAA